MKILAPHLKETLACVSPKRWYSTANIQQNHLDENRPSRRAVSNRLQELRAKRLVICQKVSREKFWRRA